MTSESSVQEASALGQPRGTGWGGRGVGGRGGFRMGEGNTYVSMADSC